MADDAARDLFDRMNPVSPAGDHRDPNYAVVVRPGTQGTPPTRRRGQQRPTVGVRGSDQVPVPRGVHPETWRLAQTLLVARRRLPYASAEARLVDGLQRFVALDAKVPVDGVSLTPGGPRWGAVVTALQAIAALVSTDTRAMLAPWLPGGVASVGAPAQGAVGVSPHAGAAAAFVASAVGGGS
jgi:hypothetical protein